MNLNESNKKSLAIIVTTVIVAFIIGIIIGNVSSNGAGEAKQKVFNKEAAREIIEAVSEDNLRDYLQELTSQPHIAASRRDRELTAWMKEKWEEFGLYVNLEEYEFLFSYPNVTNPNKIYMYDQNGEQVFSSRHKEDLRPEDEDENFIHAFNAYAPKGDVTGELVYVNYGRVEDLQRLEALNVSLEGKIAISRYGKIYRGNRLENCQHAGAIGVIMFSDPADVAPLGTEPHQVYPHTIFLPESGIQRGSTFVAHKGDKLTPTWASIPGSYRQKVEHTEGFLKIPSQPIGYGDARRLLEVMGGGEAPGDWQGGLSNLTYRMGGAFTREGWKVRLVVNNYLEEKQSSNVIGVIKGQIEPDRYVLVSNHRDAWGYGAIDPSSGTSTLMEVARVLGALAKSGWRPARTLVFCSWAAEEYGIMGSYEWVYDKIHKIMSRAVAVINVDALVRGTILTPRASPIIKDVFTEAIKAVRDPFDQSRSYYDFFKEYLSEGDHPEATVEDKVKTLGSGSDHAAFAFYAGVPSLTFKFSLDARSFPGVSGYPTYHTGFETFHLVDRLVDPGFKLHRACAQLAVHMMLQLGDDPVLPFATNHLLRELAKAVDNLEKNNVEQVLRNNGAGPAYDKMIEKLRYFNSSSIAWSNARDALVAEGLLEQPINLRIINDQIMGLERIFLLPNGLPGRPNVKHALFSPAKFNSYGSAAFPGIVDLLHQVEILDAQERTKRFEEIKKHLSDLMIIFHQAGQWLEDVHSI